MERLRRILFVSFSMGIVPLTYADVLSQVNVKATENPRQYMRAIAAKLNAKATDPETLLLELKRRLGANSPLSQRLSKNPELEKHFLELLASAKENGWGAILNLIEGDELLKSELQDLLKDGSFTSQLQDAFNGVFDPVFGAANRASGIPSSGGGLSSGGGGSAGTAGKPTGGQAPATPAGDAKINPDMAREEGQVGANEGGPGISDGAPQQVAGDTSIVQPDTQPSTLNKKLTDLGNRETASSGNNNTLGNRNTGLTGGAPDVASTMGGDQGQQPTGQQPAGAQPGSGAAAPQATQPADNSGGGVPIKGHLLTSDGKKPTGGAPLQSAAKPQAAAAAVKKPVDPDIALVQKPFYESLERELLEQYKKSPRTTDQEKRQKEELQKVRDRIKEYDAAIKKKYPKHQASSNPCALLTKQYSRPKELESLLIRVGNERQSELDKLTLSNLTTAHLTSLKWTANSEIKSYLSKLDKVQPPLECIAKANWKCDQLESSCGSKHLASHTSLCLDVKLAYQTETKARLESTDPLRCFKTGRTNELYTQAYKLAECKAFECVKANPKNLIANILLRPEEDSNHQSALSSDLVQENNNATWYDRYVALRPESALSMDEVSNFLSPRCKGIVIDTKNICESVNFLSVSRELNLIKTRGSDDKGNNEHPHAGGHAAPQPR